MSLQIHLLRQDAQSVRVRLAPLTSKQQFEAILREANVEFRNSAAAVYELGGSAVDIVNRIQDDDVDFVGFG